jgi:subtilisin family serine protease
MRIFAVASQPADVLRVAALPWVSKMTPLQVVVGAHHQREVDQRRGTPADVGANKWWDQGITGRGIRIAILDTGSTRRTRMSTTSTSATGPAPSTLARSTTPATSTAGSARRPAASMRTVMARTSPGSPPGPAREARPRPTTESTPASRGRTLAVGKALTDAGAGVNSDLLAALEWAAMPIGSDPCAAGAHIVNLSLGSEVRPDRINSDHDVDLISDMLNNLAVRYGPCSWPPRGTVARSSAASWRHPAPPRRRSRSRPRPRTTT